MFDEEDYEEQDDEESSSLILSIGEDGKASIHKEEDYVSMHKDEIELVQGFLKQHKEEFDKYIKKHEQSNENTDSSPEG